MLNVPLPRMRSCAMSVCFALAVSLLFLSGGVTPALAQRADDGLPMRGVLVVKTRALPSEREPAAMPAPRALALLRQAGLRSMRLPLTRGHSSLMSADRHGLRRIFEVRYDGDIDPRELARRLEATGEIEYAEPMPVRATSSLAPNDSAYASQYALQLIEAEGAWAVTRGDSSVIIGIVDTGLDWEHEDLAANIWRNPGEIAGNGVDDDGNGFIDDVRGWDLIGGATMSEIEQGIYREDNDPKVRVEIGAGDIRNHGTHVGGIVAATGNNGRGIAGVAYGCRLMPVKTSSDSGATYIFRGYEGILYCARNGADVVNCSWGGSTASKVEADVIAEAIDLGCVVVASAGNSSYNMDALDAFPALIPGVVAVGASTPNETEAYFSSYGVATTVFAPGYDVLSTVAGNGYAGKSGTSMSSPVVAGVAALIRSVRPDWSPAMVSSQLRSTSDSVLTGTTRNRPAYYGRVNARRAVTMNIAADSAVVPGVTLVARRWVDGASDTLRDNGTHRLALTLRNNLATTRALFVSIVPIDPQIAVVSGAGTLLDSIGRGSERVVEVDVRIPADSLWRSGTLALRIGLRDTAGYSDYLIASIPFELPARTRVVDVTPLLGEIDLDEVDSPSPEVAWISGDRITGQSTIIRIVDGRITTSSVALSSPVRIRAFDSSRCLIWSGTRIGMTDDGGTTWRYGRIDTAVAVLDRFVIFSRTEWCALGRLSKADTLIGYAFTRDAGTTWTRDTIRLDSVGASGANYDATRYGRTGLVALGSAGILRSDDAGASWRRIVIEPGTVSRIALWSERRGVLVVSTPSGMRIASTIDGGETWTTSQTPYVVPDGLGVLATPATGATSYMIGRSGSIGALSEGDVRRQIPSVRLRTRYRDVAASASDTLVRIWHVGPVAGYVDIPLRTSAAPAPEERIGLAITSIHPMPAADRLDVRVSGASDRSVMLEIIDLLGRTMLTRALDPGADAHSATLAIGELAPGRYLLRASDGEASVARAFVVMKK